MSFPWLFSALLHLLPAAAVPLLASAPLVTVAQPVQQTPEAEQDSEPPTPPPNELPPPPPVMPPPPPIAQDDAYGDDEEATLEPEAVPLNAIEVDALSLVIGYVSLRYERVLTSTWTLAINPVVGTWFYDSTGFFAGASVQARWYLGRLPLQGWYFSPQVQGIYLRDTYNRVNGHLYSVRALMGHRWLVRNALSIFLGVGVQWVWYGMNETLQGEEVEFAGFEHFTAPLFATEMGIGYAF